MKKYEFIYIVCRALMIFTGGYALSSGLEVWGIAILIGFLFMPETAEIFK